MYIIYTHHIHIYTYIIYYTPKYRKLHIEILLIEKNMKSMLTFEVCKIK